MTAIMKYLYLILAMFVSSVPPVATADDVDYQKLFQRNYAIAKYSNNEFTIVVKASNNEMKVKIGEIFSSPTDKHSKIYYKIEKVSESFATVKYSSEFEASSFGGKTKLDSGQFKISVPE